MGRRQKAQAAGHTLSVWVNITVVWKCKCRNSAPAAAGAGVARHQTAHAIAESISKVARFRMSRVDEQTQGPRLLLLLLERRIAKRLALLVTNYITRKSTSFAFSNADEKAQGPLAAGAGVAGHQEARAAG